MVRTKSPYTNVRNLLTSLDKDIESTEKQRNDLDNALKGLHEIRQRLAESVMGEAITRRIQTPAVTSGRFAGMSRIDAVELILRESDHPMHPDEVLEQLIAGGREDTRNAVAAALSYLATRKRASNPQRGQWQARGRPRTRAA